MSIGGLLLAPGAGSDRHSAALVAIDRSVTKAGLVVRRMDFPYRKAGRKAPDRAPVLVAAVVDEVQDFRAQTRIRANRVALGGRSMGGRMCSMAVAEGLTAGALVLVSYPLHPPGRPDRLRVEHFPGIEVPALFVSGTRDAFASPEELERHTRAIPGRVTHEWIEGGDHGLKNHDEEVATLIRDWIKRL